MPPQVRFALAHVREHFPKVSMVVFSSDGRWQYMSRDFDAPVFKKKIDVGILEDAVDSVEELPAVFEWEED